MEQPPRPPQRSRRYRPAAIRIELADGSSARLRDFNEGGLAFECPRAFAVGERVRAALVSAASRVEIEGAICWCEPRTEPGRSDTSSRYRVGLEFAEDLPQEARRGLTVLLASTGFWRPR